MPDASATAVSVVLPPINVTVAPAKGWEDVQEGAGPEQAVTVPLIVKPVTVSDTGIVCGLPITGAPELSVTLIVICPLYVPGILFVGLTPTPKVLPLPLSVPDLAERTSHAVLPASPTAVHVTGRAHVPVSLKGTRSDSSISSPVRAR